MEAAFVFSRDNNSETSPSGAYLGEACLLQTHSKMKTLLVQREVCPGAPELRGEANSANCHYRAVVTL